jgi:iron complex transport system ATP-binding protein
VNVAAAYCDRLILLSQGRIAADGPPAEVLTADLLRRVYGIDADVIAQADGRRVVVPRAR